MKINSAWSFWWPRPSSWCPRTLRNEGLVQQSGTPWLSRHSSRSLIWPCHWPDGGELPSASRRRSFYVWVRRASSDPFWGFRKRGIFRSPPVCSTWRVIPRFSSSRSASCGPPRCTIRGGSDSRRRHFSCVHGTCWGRKRWGQFRRAGLLLLLPFALMPCWRRIVEFRQAACTRPGCSGSSSPMWNSWAGIKTPPPVAQDGRESAANLSANDALGRRRRDAGLRHSDLRHRIFRRSPRPLVGRGIQPGWWYPPVACLSRSVDDHGERRRPGKSRPCPFAHPFSHGGGQARAGFLGNAELSLLFCGAI